MLLKPFFLCFGVTYKVFIVYSTLRRPEKSSVNKEDFRFKGTVTQTIFSSKSGPKDLGNDDDLQK